MSRYIGFLLDEGLSRYIDPLIATGLYGDGENEVIASLIRESILRAVAGNVVNVLFAEVEPAPGPSDAIIKAAFERPPKAPCPNCDDDLDIIGTCPLCGNDGMPF